MKKRLLKIALILSATIFIPLLIITLLELHSMYKTHHMPEIVYTPRTPAYWPTKAWKTSTPEKQGLDSTTLLAMVEEYRKKSKDNQIDSITIIRNEHIVADLYFNPLFPKNQKHIFNSCTKSIMSILIGIAIEKGHIKDVNVPILQLLDYKKHKPLDERMKALTLKDLLTMETGLRSQDSYLYKWEGLFKMLSTDDWVSHILNQPFEAEPGTRFDYSNMASFLLSAVIARNSGMSTLAFARQYLFEPLGIQDVRWEESPKGIHIGFARMWLRPHDMARIGLLLLQKGKWREQQIVPLAWVEESIKAHSFPKQYRYIYNANGEIDFGVSGGNWFFTNLVRPLSDGYGYQWWLDESGIFAAVGVGGQYMLVVPNQNLIFVATSKLKGQSTLLPVSLLKDFVLPAIVSKQAIAPNPTAANKLSNLSVPPALNMNPRPAPPLPQMAKQISGKTYTVTTSVDVNPWRHSNFRLTFTPNRDYADFSYTLKHNQAVSYRVGLNNAYKLTESNAGTFAAQGEWATVNTFSIDYELIGYSSRGKWLFTFNNEQLRVLESGMVGTYNYSGSRKSP